MRIYEENKLNREKYDKNKEISDKPGHLINKEEYNPIDTYGIDRDANKHTYRLSTIFGYFLKPPNGEIVVNEFVQTNPKDNTQGKVPKISLLENNSPGLAVVSMNKSKSLIKKQGTSARTLRSKGFMF